MSSVSTAALAATRSIFGRYYVQAALVAPRGDVTPMGGDLHTEMRKRLGLQAIIESEGQLRPVTGTLSHRALQRPMNKRMIARLRRRFWLLAHV
ncbi:hypothetical protein [Cellulomonas sp. Root137]|uniref:hypothetical protein n=1 Tax=Cellulomonas sp. Root137 TaxID=1736459 RepID=UPI0006FE13EA|nr:hypothetical protein [Cellulomonas sp. Root137]KQY47740.1 hypothetical protein ASD18_10745 [Cellulomonas sp. Root137]